MRKVLIAAGIVALVAVGVGYVMFARLGGPSGSDDTEPARASFAGPPSDLVSDRAFPPVHFDEGDVRGFVRYVDEIFYGTPRSASVIDRGGVMYTRFEVDVQKYVKGDGERSVVVEQIGGIDQNRRVFAIGVAPLEVGVEFLIGVKVEGGVRTVIPSFGSERTGVTVSDISEIVREVDAQR